MTEEIRKRLEEAAKNFRGFFLGRMNKCRELKGKESYSADNEIMDICLDAAELGYKEGGEWMFKECGGMTVLHDMRKLILAQCKGWLKEHTVTRMPEDDDKDFVWVESDMYEDKDEFIARFENDMTKLWEDEK